mmetsp:Transcript_7246/g.13157  ORF Transcript_7246/g.13157 Transcript_7246/m.13157 type:complete len:344 (+) Transcript_7246:184-1215(+)|eukprot:CAMPEP_0201623068 /NCGR_PEP_ID=MMETSP0492-20130828/47729_1 /ASSEMBLY_ACC=CAM_ASM_000837 /TAXON_ID=420259 /ORGANISM="Thalassiosira gravida, Strain GMp14c1" /LENGTH=343 /DNA_ID=CAMNT_0048092677 /DNA_START=46 /DNA_END=1077 /DNA_ORIENTATION=-
MMDSIYEASLSSVGSCATDDVGSYNDLFKLPYYEEESLEYHAPVDDAADAAAAQRRQRLASSVPRSSSFSSGGGGLMMQRPMRLQMNDRQISDVSFSFDSNGNDDCDDDDDRDDDIYNLSLSYHEDVRDELDSFKNRDLEVLRTAVEEAVDGVEGMMSLAVTRALTETEDASSAEGLMWDGAQDASSIEASCLCEVYGWWKRQDHTSSLDSIDEYFQDVLNIIVITVMRGTIRPIEGAPLVHGCAAILGLGLMKELPMTTLIITGMRETRDLTQGRDFILDAFRSFGTIEDVAIAPNDHKFGFVRFAKPESAQQALQRYRECGIEIQDTPVSIEMLSSQKYPW